MNIQTAITPDTQHMAPKWPAFDWQDPMLLDAQLTDEERIIRDAARGFCDETLMPVVKLANRHETFDPDLMKKFGAAGLLGPDDRRLWLRRRFLCRLWPGGARGRAGRFAPIARR